MSNTGGIMLIGFMGTGKSAIAAKLSETLGLPSVDLDALIEKSAGITIREIFNLHGEERFRELETEALSGLGGAAPVIVSCGGGAALRDINVRHMKELGVVALLTASPETVYSRIRNDSARPLLAESMSLEHIAKLMEERRARYEAAADITVQTDGRTVDEVCSELQKLLEER